MASPDKHIRKAIGDLIVSEAILHGEDSVPFEDMARFDTELNPYIYVANITSVYAGTKTFKMYDVLFQIGISHTFDGVYSGRLGVDDISDSIEDALDVDITVVGYSVVIQPYLENSTYARNNNKSITELVKMMNFKLTVQE